MKEKFRQIFGPTKREYLISAALIFPCVTSYAMILFIDFVTSSFGWIISINLAAIAILIWAIATDKRS